MSTVKVIVAGSVRGRFDAFFARLEKLHRSKAGPFDLVFCVGDFFAPATPAQLAAREADASQSVASQQLSQYIDGTKKVPLPVYFIAGCEEDAYLPGTREELCANLFYLGRSGIATLHGLSVAYISGHFGDTAQKRPGSGFLRGDFESLVSTWALDFPRGVDLLLTNQWPRGIFNCLRVDERPSDTVCTAVTQQSGEQMPARAAHILRPRYHFAGRSDIYWSRVPYRNRESLSDHSRQTCTRFLALAPAFNEQKQKYVYAVNLVPLKEMDDDKLYQQPEKCTECVFVVEQEEVVGGAGGGGDGGRNAARKQATAGKRSAASVFGALQEVDETGGAPQATRAALASQREAASSAGVVVQRWSGGGHGGGGGGRKRRRVAPPPVTEADCWFCLKSAHVEKHLVVTVGTELYVALAKGGLVDEHMLIIPIEHTASSTQLTPTASAELEQTKRQLREYCERELQRDMVVFERQLVVRGTMHMHVQCVPVPRGTGGAAAAERWRALGKAQGYVFEPLADGRTLRDAVEERDDGEGDLPPYLYVEAGGEHRLLHFIDRSRRFDLQFGRAVCADIMGTPERADWRQCVLDDAEATAVAKRVRTALLKK